MHRIRNVICPLVFKCRANWGESGLMGKWAMLSLLSLPRAGIRSVPRGLSDPENSHGLCSLPAVLGKATHPLSKPAAQGRPDFFCLTNCRYFSVYVTAQTLSADPSGALKSHKLQNLTDDHADKHLTCRSCNRKQQSGFSWLELEATT